MKNANVLYVDQEISQLTKFKSAFGGFYQVFTATSAEQATELMANNEIQVLITVQKIQAAIGTRLLEQAVKDHPDQVRILLSGHTDQEAPREAVQSGLIFRYVPTPYIPEVLKQIIEMACELYSLKKVREQLYREWVKTEEELQLLRIKKA